jgi:hypothetical protein
VEVTGEGEGLSFESDIRPLFRERDRGTMLGFKRFDLWARDDVADHSQAILERLENGSKPCVRAWPDEGLDPRRPSGGHRRCIAGRGPGGCGIFDVD